MTLNRQADQPGAQAAASDALLRNTDTGAGKWTTLAMLGVHSNLRKAGCNEKDGHGERLTQLGMAPTSLIGKDVEAALRLCRPPKQ